MKTPKVVVPPAGDTQALYSAIAELFGIHALIQVAEGAVRGEETDPASVACTLGTAATMLMDVMQRLRGHE